MSIIEQLFRELPPEKQIEVEDFARFLMQKNTPKEKRTPDFSWAGALKDMGTEFTSVELQQQILLLRSNTK